MANENSNVKSFLVSTADFAFYVNDVLACTGTANLNTSLEVSMQEQNVNGGKYNKLLYTFLYNRELSATLEAANWDLRYIAANVGSTITEGLTDVYKIEECVDIVGGVGTLASTPIGNVAVMLADGNIIEVTPEGSVIDVSGNVTEGMVKATYRYNTVARTVTIDADTTPYVGKLVLDADRHNNKVGKVGSVQIIIPSYQLTGNFSISFSADGVSSTNLDGKALAVAGEKCSDGSSVYALIKEFDMTATAMAVTDIAATPSVMNIAVDEEKAISVKGLKGGMYAPIELDNADCEFTVAEAGIATVTGGVVKGVSAGTTNVVVAYGEYQDVVQVTVA